MEKYITAINVIVNEIIPMDSLSLDEKLAIIASDSIKAITFLSAIEEEYDIEIDDDLINSDFFLNVKYMAKCIDKMII